MTKLNVNTEMLGEAPKDPHLAVYTDSSGLAVGMPPGSNFALVFGPREGQPLIFVKLTKKEIVFRCACDPRCKQVLRYKLSVSGGHPRK